MNDKSIGKMKVRLDEWDYDAKEMKIGDEVSTYLLAKNMNSEQFAYFLSEYLNISGKQYREGEEIGKRFRIEHRSLQRSAVAFCLGFLAGISEQEWWDPRNETAIKTAKKVKEMVENGDLPLGPYL